MPLFEIVNDATLANLFKHLFDEFNMHGMDLIVVLGLFVFKNQVECRLVGLFNHWTVASDHSANMKFFYSWNRSKIFLRSFNELIGGSRVVRIGPKNNHVRKHARGK